MVFPVAPLLTQWASEVLGEFFRVDERKDLLYEMDF